MGYFRANLEAYKLLRTIGIGGVFSALMAATRGITAGSVHATIELRVILIDWLDQTVAIFPVTLTVYVDDTSLEDVGPHSRVRDNVRGATICFCTA